MPRPRFSDMLYDRRRELGLSIKQASNVLRLKEEVLIAFEEGDFDSIPKSGYAQGMLSSYARYLGLNAKTIVNQFSTDLLEHERGANSHEARRRNRQNRSNADGPLYQTPQANAFTQARGNRMYFESRGFLPTSGGFAGDMGDFATTSAARPRYSSAGSTGSLREERDDYPQNRSYASYASAPAGSVPLGQSRPTERRESAASRGQYGQGYQSARTRGGYGGYESATARRLGAPVGDRRADGDGRGYQSSSTVAGRRSSRSATRSQRSNVRRRPTSSGTRTSSRGRNTASRSEGFMGIVEEFFSDRTRVMLFGGALACILLIVIITSISSCVRGRQQSDKTVAITATDQPATTTETETSDVSKEEEEKARAEAAAAKAAETEATVTERTLEVTIADGEVTWIEIEYDGKSDIAETVTGPWNRTYTVRQSITISANKPAAVTVTEGGKKLEFDDKSSGIGIISIQVAKKSDAEANDALTGDANKDDASKGDGESQQTTDGTESQDQYSDSGQTDYGDLSYDDSGDDGYTYTEYGYYDQYGNFYEYE